MKMKRPGFTLTELLTAILAGSVACAAAMHVAGQAAGLMSRLSDRGLAWERGQNALSIIESRAKHAALGIDISEDVFRHSFGLGNNPPPPAGWKDRGPLQIWDGDGYTLALAPNQGGVYRGRAIAILYAVPGALWAYMEDGAPITLTAGKETPVRLEPRAELDVMPTRLPIEDTNDLRSWVTFPLTRLPLHAVHSGGGVKIRSALPGTIYPFDEIHFLRGYRFYAQSGTLYSAELRKSWTQIETRLEGVLEMWFEWTPSEKFLEAWILTTGGASAGTAKPKDWPEAAPWREEFGRHETAVTRGSWILKNM